MKDVKNRKQMAEHRKNVTNTQHIQLKQLGDDVLLNTYTVHSMHSMHVTLHCATRTFLDEKQKFKNK